MAITNPPYWISALCLRWRKHTFMGTVELMLRCFIKIKIVVTSVRIRYLKQIQICGHSGVGWQFLLVWQFVHGQHVRDWIPRGEQRQQIWRQILRHGGGFCEILNDYFMNYGMMLKFLVRGLDPAVPCRSFTQFLLAWTPPSCRSSFPYSSASIGE